MNTQTNFNFLQKPLCPSVTQLSIKFSQMNFLRVYICNFTQYYSSMFRDKEKIKSCLFLHSDLF